MTKEWTVAPPHRRVKYIDHAYIGVVQVYNERLAGVGARISGWISPEGDFYPDGRDNDYHPGAERTAKKLGLQGVRKSKYFVDYSDALRDVGFRRLSNDGFNLHGGCTDAQLLTAQLLVSKELDKHSLYLDDEFDLWVGVMHETDVDHFMRLKSAQELMNLKERRRPEPVPEERVHPVLGSMTPKAPRKATSKKRKKTVKPKRVSKKRKKAKKKRREEYI